ncbi:hypothetical protein OAG68_02890 [bacterium]|nr:hypothetical protein [bacterium]
MYTKSTQKFPHYGTVTRLLAAAWIGLSLLSQSAAGQKKNPIGSDQDDNSQTYMDNFRSLCDQSNPISTKILKQPMRDDIEQICVAMLEQCEAQQLGLKKSPQPEKIRIGVNDIDAGTPVAWQHLVSERNRITIDILRYPDAKTATKIMDQRGQAHSGTMNQTDACLFLRSSRQRVLIRFAQCISAAPSFSMSVAALPFRVLSLGPLESIPAPTRTKKESRSANQLTL